MKKQTHLWITAIIASTILTACGGSGSNETVVSEPDTVVPITSQLLINEIVADAIDDGNDWIELYALEGPVSLANYTLVDDNNERTPQALPDVTLAQGEFIVIQAIDEEDTPPDSGYYVTFKLGSDDAVTLFKDGVQSNTLDWEEGDAQQGSSYGLYTDGTGTAQTLSPTPGEANQQSTADITYDLIINENAPIRINEIVAKNSESEYDWVELYVTGHYPVNLSDYQLADENNELVNLPNITLESGEFYRLYATTELIENTQTIAFKLGSSDQVSLYQGDDLVDQLNWKKGQALIGYSYGRFPDGSDGTFVLTPSPQSENTKALHGPIVINEIVANDQNGGYDWFELYNNSDQQISLASYQVIDASDDIEPVTLPDVVLAPGDYLVIFASDEELTEHYVPFKLGNNDELNLMLHGEVVDYIDWDSSDVNNGYSYGLSASNSSDKSWHKDFLTPTQGAANELATAFEPDVVRSLYIDISDENWQSILASPLEEEYHEASITFDGITLDSIAIRTKGGSSLRAVSQSNSDRYSFKIDINEYVDGQKFFGLKKFTLQNSYNDPSYMREVIAYDLMKEIGVAAPEHAYVNVYINNELFGFYLMVEVIDSEFIENYFDNTNGDLYKPDGTGSDLQWISGDITDYTGINQQNNEETTDNGAFINFIEEMDAGSDSVIDVDSLLRYMSVSVSLSNLDSYHGTLAHNYYIYEQDGLFTFLPWDLNESFGTFSMGCRSDIRGLYIDEPTSGALSERPMVANVFANQDHLDTYHDYLWQLIEGPLADNAFAHRVDAIAALIDEHVANDPSAFYGYSNFIKNLDNSVDKFYGLTSFMTYRVDNMRQQLNGSLPSSGTGQGYCN